MPRYQTILCDLAIVVASAATTILAFYVTG